MFNSFFDDFDKYINEFMKKGFNTDHTWKDDQYFFYGIINGKGFDSKEKFNEELRRIANSHSDSKSKTQATGSSHSVSSEIKRIEAEIQTAVSNENYEKAASLKKELDVLKENETEILTLNKELEGALAVQDYEKAIEIRDQKKKLLEKNNKEE